MTKLLLKRKVVELRKSGKSYSEIKKLVNVSKSSLSLWLKNIPLSEKQLFRLKLKKEITIERFRESMRKKRIDRLLTYYDDQRSKWTSLTEREIFLAGLFLYWGEGNKVSSNVINISNNDPAIIKFSIYWIEKSLGIPRNKIYIKLHLYKDMDVAKEIDYWVKTLQINESRFSKPYIKKSSRLNIDHKGFGHGTCNISAYNTVLKENILMCIKAISDNYGKNL